MDSTSFLKVMDKGIQALMFTKFKDTLGLVDLNNDTVFYPKEVAFRQMAEKRGAAQVEFLSVWRDRTEFSWARQRTPLSRVGMQMSYVNPDDKKSINVVKAVPTDLHYDVWFWTKDYDKYNKIAERYMFWVQTYPNIDLFYNDYPISPYMKFGEMTDESTTSEMFDKGLYFVLRASVDVEGWVFLDETLERGRPVPAVRTVTLKIYDNTVEQAPQLIYEASIYGPPTIQAFDLISISEGLDVVLPAIGTSESIRAIDAAMLVLDLVIIVAGDVVTVEDYVAWELVSHIYEGVTVTIDCALVALDVLIANDYAAIGVTPLAFVVLDQGFVTDSVSLAVYILVPEVKSAITVIENVVLSVA